jgi:large subunit ribosomal protein L10
MNREQKKQCVNEMGDVLRRQSLVVVLKQVGLTVEEANDFRNQMRKEGAGLKIMKNTLARLAIKESGLKDLHPFLIGPTALAFSEDSLSAAKVVVKFAEKSADKVQIVAGWMDGRVLSASNVGALAALPSLDELRARFLSLLMAPATKVVRVIKEPLARVARVVGAKNS